jgi:uncharacterized membrane protein YgcG
MFSTKLIMPTNTKNKPVHPIRAVTRPFDTLRFQTRAIASGEPGDTTATALLVKPFKGGQSFVDSVAPTDADLYCFKVKRRSPKLSVFANNEGGGSFQGCLLDRNGQPLTRVVADSALPSTTGATIYEGRLRKGIYYIRLDFLQSLNPDIAYKLYFEEVKPAIPDESEDGGSWGGSGSGGSSGGGSSGGGHCQFASDIASDGSRCGGRASSERPGGR